MLTLPFKFAYTIHSHPQLSFRLALIFSLQEDGLRQFFFQHAPAKGSALKLLNIGLTPDVPFTKSSSVPPIKPIGSGFSSPSRQALLKDGPAFSTDTDSNTAETRFERFGLIPTE
ncbi:hypothetical protein KCU61_g7226, partial [Aureobasidium melanogenum]